MNYFGIRATTRQNANSNNYLSSLVDNFRKHGLAEQLSNFENLSIKHQKLTIARVSAYYQTNKCGNLGNLKLPYGPLDAIVFRSSAVAERILDGNIEINSECLVCSNNISNDSVLFECACVATICQACAFEIVASQQDTYSTGIKCPICKEYSQTLQNVTVVRSEEDELIQQSLKYFKSEKTDLNSHPDMYALYEKLHNSVCSYLKLVPNSRKLVLHESFYAVTMLPCLKLEVARLEAFRQDLNAGVNSKYCFDSYLPLGPLTRLKFLKNAFLEYAIQFKVENPVEVHHRALIDDQPIVHDNQPIEVGMSSSKRKSTHKCPLCRCHPTLSDIKLKHHYNKFHKHEISDEVLAKNNWCRCSKCYELMDLEEKSSSKICPSCIKGSSSSKPQSKGYQDSQPQSFSSSQIQVFSSSQPSSSQPQTLILDEINIFEDEELAAGVIGPETIFDINNDDDTLRYRRLSAFEIYDARVMNSIFIHDHNCYK